MPTIEQNLERIADALEKIAAQGGSISVVHNAVGAVSETKVDVKADKPADDSAKKAAEAKAAADAKKAADAKAAADAKKAADEKAAADAAAAAALDDKPKSTKTKDDVRKALQAYREIEGTPAMLEVLKKHGAANLNELAEDQYDAVVAAVS